MTTDTDNRVGTLVAQYRLEEPLGEGGASSVYRATPVRGGRAVALKLLDPRVAKQPQMRDRFEREARALNGLEHPHLIRLLDFGFDANEPYLVTELLEGMPLDQLLLARPLGPTLAFELGLGFVAGLAHAHAHGVLHRDLKPANIFIARLPDGMLHPKLLDFGLVRFLDDDRWGHHQTLTEEGAILGTPQYMAPEQGFGHRVDARSDVYSAGIVLYELLAARLPFSGATRAAWIRAHAIETPPALGSIRPGLIVQPALEAVIMRALAKKPEDRFEHAGVMLRALEAVPEPPARYG